MCVQKEHFVLRKGKINRSVDGTWRDGRTASSAAFSGTGVDGMDIDCEEEMRK